MAEVLFKLWPGGTVNRLTSLENAHAICRATQSNVLVHSNDYLSSEHRNLGNRNGILGKQIPRLSDLVNTPDGITFTKTNLSGHSVFHHNQPTEKKLFHTCLSIDGTLPSKEFLDWRQKVVYLQKGVNYEFVETLGWRGIIFWAQDASVRASLFAESEIVMRIPYVELAKTISDELGDFASIHVRRKDMREFNSSNDQDVEYSIKDILDYRTKLLFTDEPESTKWIVDKYGFMLFDDFLYDQKQKFTNLPFSDETVFGLVSLLVACESNDFIGTLGSTYSGYIHRAVRKKAGKNYLWKYFKDTKIDNNSKWEWQKYEIEPAWKVFWRQYDEFID